MLAVKYAARREHGAPDATAVLYLFIEMDMENWKNLSKLLDATFFRFDSCTQMRLRRFLLTEVKTAVSTAEALEIFFRYARAEYKTRRVRRVDRRDASGIVTPAV